MPSITPLKLKTGDSTANGEDAKRTERRIYSVSEMEDHFVGSQTPLDFLRTWMGKKSPQKELEAKFPTAQSVFMKEFDASQNEGDRTKILVRGF
jgi:outer membrane biogenesis lipoprotein LolB